MRSPLNWIIAIIIVLPLILYPAFPASNLLDINIGAFSFQYSTSSFLFLFSFVLTFVVAATGLNVQTGFGGQLNLGFAGFMAIGAYAAAILQVEYRDLFVAQPFVGIGLSLLVSAASAAVIGFLICLPTLRLRGDYFAIVTFGFAELVRQIIKNERWTHGTNGINDLKLVNDEQLDAVTALFAKVLPPEKLAVFQADFWVKYAFFVVITAATTWIVTCLRDSHFGRALFALRENATAAESSGISLTKTKILAFIVSSAIGGVAGYMLIMRNGSAHPNMFMFMISIYVLCGLVLGGMGSVRGTILGTLILMSTGELLRDILVALPKDANNEAIVPQQARIILFGLVLVVMMRFRPNGVVTLESDTRRLAEKDDLEALKEDGTPSPYYKVGDQG